MAIPKHEEIRKHILEFLKDGKEKRPREFEEPLARLFNLTEEELTRLYDSGNGPIFYDRISWSLSFLSMAGLVSKPRRGIYTINDDGRALLKTPEKIDAYVDKKLAERERLQKKKSSATSLGRESDLTPQELLEVSYKNIRQSAYDEIIDTILNKTPRAFEHLVVQLLQRMGYGGEIKGSGEVTQYSNDGGIDGVIKEDILGLGRINIQAKRYDRKNTINREEIQKFVGALAVAQSNKGIFITTSSYSSGALEYAENLNGNTTLVLIDGQELAKYIYDYNLGMQTEQVIEIKRMDGEYWDHMQNA